jgi:hypothetical protein
MTIRTSSQFPSSLVHTHQPNARSRIAKALEHFLLHSAALILHFQNDLVA